MQFIGFRVLIRRIKAIKYLLADKTVPKRKKALIIGGIIYLILPVDIIPPILFPFGFLDDLIIWAFILIHLKDELDSYWDGDKKSDFSQKYDDKNIVEGVNFKVENEDNKDDDDKDKE